MGAMPSSRSLHVRPATEGDVETVLGFIHALAEYEKLSHCLDTDAAKLREHLFGPRPACEALIGEVGGRAAGFALFFQNYSTFLTSPGLYLEDLFVSPEARGSGLGKALLANLAKLAVERGIPRLDWAVLDWNTPAIEFYEHLGAQRMMDWRTCRLDGEALRAVANRA